jgi:hypothetical protein
MTKEELSKLREYATVHPAFVEAWENCQKITDGLSRKDQSLMFWVAGYLCAKNDLKEWASD